MRTNNKGARPSGWLSVPLLLASGSMALWASSAQAVDPIAGYDPTTDAPSNAYSFDFEGCNLDTSTESTYDPANGVFVCDSDTVWPAGGNADSYTDGNLGKQWEELDEVPHRIGTDSSGAAGPETYKIVIGGDSLINPATTPPTVGYDRITVFGLNGSFSDASCNLTVIGGNQIGDFGIGGADTQVVQVLEITQDADTECVIDSTYRLAIGSSLVSGSSNRGFVVAGTGDQSIPIPSDIQPQTLSKTMSAVEDSLINWTIQKIATPTNFSFGNTCNIDVPNTKDVQIDVTFTKGATEFGDLTATTTIDINNPSSRVVRYNCTDMVYGDEPDDGQGEILVDSKNLVDFDVDPGMVMPTIEHILTPGTRDIRNVLSCAISVEDILVPDTYIPVGFLDAEFTLPNDDIAAGEVVNESVIVTDTESLTLGAARYDFSAAQTGGVSGNFLNGYAGANTDGPVDWQSDPQTDSGTVQFTKTVTVERGYDVNGKLEDTASIDLTDTTDVSASAATTFSTDPKIDLKVTKTLGFAVSGDTTWDFTVKNSLDVVVASPQITISGGLTYGEITVDDLDPGTYTVTETVVSGFVPAANPQNVVLSLPNCAGQVDFVNNPASNFFAQVEVKKMTQPAGQEAGWTFDLSGPENAQLVSTDANFKQFDLSGGGNTGADVGSYSITEQLKPGWQLKTPNATTLNVVGCLDSNQNAGPIAGVNSCDFDVSYLAYAGCTFQCTFENIQDGKIIVKKVTDPTTSTQTFEFDGDAAGTIGHGGMIMQDVAPGTYTSTETVPDGWDLTSISCDDDQSASASSGNLNTATATFNVEPGETVTCTFTNVERGMADVTKTFAGLPPTGDQSASFDIRKDASTSSTGTVVASATADASNYPNTPFTCVAGPELCVDVNGMAKLPPGTYQFCESGMYPGWSTTLSDFAGAFPLPSILSTTFVPNGLDPLASNDTYCVDFELAAGETESFQVDNTPPPGGDARTIGYWKNWNDCTNGNQDDVLGDTLDQLVDGEYIRLGTVMFGNDANCEDVVLILDKRDTDGKKQASDPCFNAASQLLASELNEIAGARTCQDLVGLQGETQDALIEAGFDGDRCNLKKRQDADLISLLNTNAGLLDAYNNNDPGAVCN